jgi:primosomal protein N' (replication factor Y)
MTEQQRRLFEDEPVPWDEDDGAEQQVATVVFPAGPPGEFDYLVPNDLAEEIEAGRRVRVPLGRGNRLQTGYCILVQSRVTRGRRLKPLSAVVDPCSLLPASMLRVTKWIADYYLCPWGQVLETVVPAGVRGQAGTRLTTFLFVEPTMADGLGELKLTKKQAEVMRHLAGAAQALTPAELARVANCSQAPITALRRKGLIRSRTERVSQRKATRRATAREDPLHLNRDQDAALGAMLEALNSNRHQTVLVHGVTGSGKTEVYMQAIEEVNHFGRQAIVLVPEISLTPQTVQRFRARFDHVAVLHSHLSDAERHWQWRRIADGGVQVVVGARSAIFAPVPDLGLVVLDEEHEASFKQDKAPRYHARDVAIARCRAESVPLVLGSATPSLESWHRARRGEYTLVEMPRRVLGRPLPEVGTIDLRTDIRSRGSRGAISRQLHMAMREALRDGGQVILLLNRRGFSTHIQCPACGEVVRCPDCDIAMTHHRTEDIALCHFCDHQEPAPTKCDKCGFVGIRYAGIGTQRLESEVKTRFPDVPCLRMDTDAMQARGSHERAFEAFRSGQVRILLGTQMIAKGLDFPNVTLVGVINADTALHFPDFRAAERTFQLVTQVAGRTGRGDRGGRVLIQTYSPDHPAIQAAARHDYAMFASQELPIRETLSYPPFSSMIRVVVRGPIEQVASDFAASLADGISANLADCQATTRVLGPAPAPLNKLRGKFRFHIQIQAPETGVLREAVRRATAKTNVPEGVFWIADVDPLDML